MGPRRCSADSRRSARCCGSRKRIWSERARRGLNVCGGRRVRRSGVMPVYAYKGLNDKGRNVGGIIDADSPKTARIKLRRSGIYPTDLNETRERPGGGGAEASVASRFSVELSSLFQKITPQDLALMTRQLATLVGAGLPRVECLGAPVDPRQAAADQRRALPGHEGQ